MEFKRKHLSLYFLSITLGTGLTSSPLTGLAVEKSGIEGSEKHGVVPFSQPINNIFPDENFSKLIAHTLHKSNVNAVVTQEELNSITSLISYIDTNKIAIRNLEGIRFLKNLESLSFRDSLLGENENNNHLEEISSLTRLSIVVLENNKLTDISLNKLHEMKSLMTLDLDNNQITAFNLHLPKLNTLILSSNKLNNISGIKNSKETLSGVYLNGNELQDINDISELKNIKSLNLSDNKLTSIAALQELVNIEAIDLSHNNIKDISALKNMRQLRHVNLAYNNALKDITPLSPLTDITELYLNDNNLGDAGMESIKSLVKLRVLNASGNSLVNINEYMQKLVSLANIDLSNNKINSIAVLRNINDNSPLPMNIDIAKNKVKDISPISHLKSLEKLDISENELTDLSSLDGLLSLKEFSAKKQTIILPTSLYLENFLLLRDKSGLTPDVDRATSTDVADYDSKEWRLTWKKIGDNHLVFGNDIFGGTIKQLTATDAPIKNLFPDPLLAALVGKISGKKPDVEVNAESLAGIKKLYNVIDPAVVSPQSLEGISQLKNLERVWLYNSNQATGIGDITPLLGLKKLRQLTLSHMRLDSVRDFEYLQGLEELVLKQIKVNDLSLLNQLPKLKILSVEANFVLPTWEHEDALYSKLKLTGRDGQQLDIVVNGGSYDFNYGNINWHSLDSTATFSKLITPAESDHPMYFRGTVKPQQVHK